MSTEELREPKTEVTGIHTMNMTMESPLNPTKLKE